MSRIKHTWALFALVPLVVHLLSAAAWAQKRIGILLFSQDARYSEAQKGIVAQLEKDGFREPAVKFIVENADGNKVKAAELARKFAAARMDLIISLGTATTMALVREVREVPIVFGVVYDPVEAKIARDWRSSGNNTTGACTKVPMATLVDYLKAFAPVKRLAVLYTPTEKNSVTQLKELLGVQDSAHIKVVPVPVVQEENIADLLPEVLRSADALYLSGSTVVATKLPTVLVWAKKARMPTITHLDDLVARGVLLGVCADCYAVGRLTGVKAVRVLRGAKPASIPIEAEKKLEVIVNLRTAKAGRYRLPESFLKRVTKVIE